MKEYEFETYIIHNAGAHKDDAILVEMRHHVCIVLQKDDIPDQIWYQNQSSAHHAFKGCFLEEG